MRFLFVIGTRPEAIKLAPLIMEVGKKADVTTLCSGQHTTMVQEALDWFGISPDEWIERPPGCDTLAELTSAMMVPLERAIKRRRPDIVVGQGDTTTVMVTSLVSFYLGVPFAHVEAGLRTGDRQAPFPEEANRVIIANLASWHFCPTPRAVANLRREGIQETRIFMTGNTVIDALRLTVDKAVAPGPNSGFRRILLTAHRRENHGDRIDDICRAVTRLTEEFSDIEFIIPVHLNPKVQLSFVSSLEGRERVALCPPLRYPQLVREMARAHIIITDSGGIQEEAPFLKKPVLVLRDVTERPEAVELGVARLVGTYTETVVAAVRELLTDNTVYNSMASGGSPYGDGHAAERIARALGVSP